MKTKVLLYLALQQAIKASSYIIPMVNWGCKELLGIKEGDGEMLGIYLVEKVYYLVTLSHLLTCGGMSKFETQARVQSC